MTLPTGQISMSQIAAELGINATGLNLNHGWVRALAGRPSGTISFSDLRGQSGRIDGSYPTQVAGGGKYIALNAPFFGATVSRLSFSGAAGQTSYTLEVSAGCRWNGNVSVRNNTTGGVIVLPWNGSLWSVASGDGSLIRTSTTDNFSIVPA
ncbi:hypothetical protein [Burkholderia multivorans]|uniref:hypothetical protein n=1 Tax=Burkholderia multivorans TaxID=87883 RepID=UPI0020191E6A|nr:hypothetical protein [Burkholderia multivorans]MCL4651641.1 hypothetical protein [Burkholderia multivorans]MCL4655136.1 hypothetical protein [Burkholderia multivorans]MCO1426147.1 hypothetical protein [Burkholderia multivorans]UQN51192.1 hypothetical protein L0Y88_08995 [Burkholderia multivorans]UQN84457.1 hypothetical protein L0Z18_19605 [Burkholderia multivorans]